MKILGIAAPFGHDASAALVVDGKIVAAAEEERFTRKKHAKDQMPVNAIAFCLRQAGLTPDQIDAVAFPWSVKALRRKRAEYLFRTIFHNPSRAYKKFFRNGKELKGQRSFVDGTLKACGFDARKTRVEWVEHHLAHAASSFYPAGFKEAAILSVDGGGEITSTLIGSAAGNRLRVMKEVVAPDSLGNFYATMTDYLGFEREDGEYKVMGMAPYGDAKRIDLDHVVWWDERRKTYHCNDEYVWVKRGLRFRNDKVYSRKMAEELGPEREGDDLSEPYVHIAAATQAKLEEITLKLLDAYLTPELKRHQTLCFSGGCALNVSLNRKLLEHPLVKNLWVQPASHDAGGSLGAAVYVAAQAGDTVRTMDHVYLGPEFSEEEILKVLKGSGLRFERVASIGDRVADMLKQDKIVGWFQGRMEWGPRALGNRTILGNPTIPGTNDRINAIIKFREKWRPFCPSLLKEFAAQILGSDHPAPFMTLSFRVADAWKDRIPEAVHVDGSCRPQVVDQQTNPKYYHLIQSFYKKTGVPVVINTSLNRRGEPMVCSPQDALVMLKESGLEYLAIGDFLVSKKD